MVKLYTDDKGNVTGALIKGKHSGLYRINAKAVVLATGGIGANAKLVQSLRPDISADCEHVQSAGQPGRRHGARTEGWRGCGRCQGNSAQSDIVGRSSPVIVSETVRGAGAVFVNREGKRFISELTTRDVTSAAVSKQTGWHGFCNL